MADSITTTAIPTQLTVIFDDNYDDQRKQDFLSYIDVALDLCNAYVNPTTPYRMQQVTLTATNHDPNEPLEVPENYPIIQLTNVTYQSEKLDAARYTYDARNVYFNIPNGVASNITLVYDGGIPPSIYKAVIRQTKIMDEREATGGMPEQSLDISGAMKFDKSPQYLTGLSSDVRSMLSPYRRLSF